MGVLADKLLKAVKELTGATLNLEQSVKKQEENNKNNADVISKSIGIVTEGLEKGVKTVAAATDNGEKKIEDKATAKVSELIKALELVKMKVNIVEVSEAAATAIKAG